MKANCYKGDSAEIVRIVVQGICFALLMYPQEDPMKPMLETIIDKVVRSLSGEARAFFDREFSFFNEVTSISGKLKPYIRKTTPEKKVFE